MTIPAPLRRRVVATVLAVLSGLALAAMLGEPAGAHGGEGQLDLVSADRSAGSSVALVVRLTYVNDGDPVTDATVTAVVGDAASVPLGAGDEAGVYQGTVDAPAGSTIRVTSVTPVVTLDVPAPAATPTTTAEAPSTTTTEAPTTEVPTTTDATTTSAPPEGDGAAVGEEDDDGLSPGILVALGGGVVVVAGLVAFGVVNLNQSRADERTDTRNDAGGPPSEP